MERTEHILIVDDEETIRTVTADALAMQGFHVQTAADASQALELLSHTRFDLALLDLMMPGSMDGVGLMNEIRKQSPQTTVIMMSAYATLDSAIAALRQGAYDYILKPTSLAQIVESVENGLAKRRNTLRRQQLIAGLEATLRELKQDHQIDQVSDTPAEGRFIKTLALTIDRQKRLVVQGNQSLELTPTEFDILDFLANHPERVVTARELIQAAQGYDLIEEDARPLVRVHIQRLRQKLGDDPDDPHVILNVRGKGYRFVG